MIKWPSTLPARHKQFIVNAVNIFSQDPRILGLAGSGSFGENKMDEFSDIDLLVAIEPDKQAELLSERLPIAQSLGNLLSGFSGEHVGEPRVFICLYGPEPLHVDLKFVALPDAAQRVDHPKIIWQRDNLLSDILATGDPHYPTLAPQWVEDRFWVWIHYATTKIGRGELFEALDFVGFLRSNILVPMIQTNAGLEAMGIRKVEATDTNLKHKMLATIACYDRKSIIDALRACIRIYRDDCVTELDAKVNLNQQTEQCALKYLTDIESRFV